MANFDAFANLTDVLCPNVPRPVMEGEIRRTIREWCEETNVLQRLTTLDVVAEDDTYALTIPTGEEPVRLLRAFCYGKGLTPIARMDVTNPDVLYNPTVSNQPQVAIMDPNTSGSVQLYPKPSEDRTAGFIATCVTRPTITASTFDDALANYAYGISYGAAAKLMAMPSQLWTNQAWMQYYQTYQWQLARCKAEIARGGQRQGSRVRPRYFP